MSRRSDVEALLDTLSGSRRWSWTAALSLLLDQAVLEEERAR